MDIQFAPFRFCFQDASKLSRGSWTVDCLVLRTTLSFHTPPWRIASDFASKKPSDGVRHPWSMPTHTLVGDRSLDFRKALGQKLWWPFSWTRPAKGAICYAGEKDRGSWHFMDRFGEIDNMKICCNMFSWSLLSIYFYSRHETEYCRSGSFPWVWTMPGSCQEPHVVVTLVLPQCWVEGTGAFSQILRPKVGIIIYIYIYIYVYT